MDAARAALCQTAGRPLRWAVLGILLVALYAEILLKWGLALWDDPNYSHGLFIPFLSLYLLGKRWPRIRQFAPQPSLWGASLLLAAALLYVLGTVSSEFFTRRVSLIIALFGLILSQEGKASTRELLFPIGILAFAVPLPYVLYNAVAVPLRHLASIIAAWLLQIGGSTVYLEGNIIHLPHTTLEVVNACSGIRSLMTLITLAFFLTYFRHHKLWQRALVVVLAVPFSVLANAGRVAATGWLTRYDPQWSEGFRHEATGWLVFIASFGLLLIVSSLLERRRQS